MINKGKLLKQWDYRGFKVDWGTVDQLELKSVYIDLESWSTLMFDVDDISRIIRDHQKKLKYQIRHFESDLFKSECIVDIQSKNNQKYGKPSYTKIEIILFTDKLFQIKDDMVIDEISGLIKSIIDSLNSFPEFEYSLKKLDNVTL